MYSQTTRQRTRTGKFRRQDNHERAHHMIVSWAAHMHIRNNSSVGQGYSIGILQEYSGLPPHSLIPKGVQFTSTDDIKIENWIIQAPRDIQDHTVNYYIDGKKITPKEKYKVLSNASKWLFS